MWETLPIKKQEAHARPFFLSWTESIATKERTRRAEDTLIRLESDVPEIRQFRTTPQSPPWHSEGPFVIDHIRRILIGLYAVTDGEDLLEVEELAREKHHHPELVELQETIREHAATLEAFALLHDIAKPQQLFFNAPASSRGEVEGYRQRDQDHVRRASDRDRETYRKLVEAMSAGNPELSPSELAARFFDQYEIRAHYHGHDRVGASDTFLAQREFVSDRYRLPARDRAMLTFAIRHHIDVFHFFKNGPNPEKYNLLIARADKQGFDADDALDFLLAGIFLDATMGGLIYLEGQFSCDQGILFNMLESEALARGERRTRRRERQNAKREEVFRQMLKEVGLGSEDIFALLSTPFGPERAEIVAKVEDLVRRQNADIHFSLQGEEMTKRIKLARASFDPEKMA